MNNPALALNQRVIYAALSRMTDDRSVIKSAYQFWQGNLSAKPFDIIESVTELVNYLGLSGQEKKVLMVSMHAASNKLIDELAQVPAVISEENPGSAQMAATPTNDNNTQTSSKSPQYEVIEFYLQQFVQNIRKVDPSDFTDFRTTIAKEGVEGVTATINNALIQWAKDGFSNLSLAADISQADCKTIAHQLYLLATEFIGPMETDNVVTKSIDNCLNLEAATRFNPRNLI